MAFETVIALLIYSLVLFPNIDNFVDVNAMRIFLIRNLVPTLLGDTYFSIHYRISKRGGTIVCYVHLLYKWFISHLLQSPIFQKNKDCLRWSQRLMSLTNDDITWYSSSYDDVEIIDSYGEFSNVPLLDTQGGINYNPTLARRQLGFDMKEKLDNILLEGLFFQEEKDTQGLKAKMSKMTILRHGKRKQQPFTAGSSIHVAGSAQIQHDKQEHKPEIEKPRDNVYVSPQLKRPLLPASVGPLVDVLDRIKSNFETS
ncbi:uncharacterized protein LOC127137071 [Lathyrus oleraceus]|uniref:uncharacterized protein LOC127137071 n=1 Tax=Pisum sativum TaxID=3888 RepID=UPI0021CFF65D|nr:uncharacterized protein LOC127137071 [Pisum sativum]